jgi:hypothetical protein
MRIVSNSSGARAAQFSTIIALDPVLDTTDRAFPLSRTNAF